MVFQFRPDVPGELNRCKYNQTPVDHRYVVDGSLTAADGSRLNVRSAGILILMAVRRVL
jgi:hypothetical protein